MSNIVPVVQNINTFFETLFRPGEKICVTKDQRGTALFDWRDAEIITKAEFFCVNPSVSGRKNVNVTAHRNILVEFDAIPLDEQAAYVAGIGMPFTTCVFSGNKSFHYVISLAQDVSKETYKEIVKQVHAAVGAPVDKSCKNEARLSRFPNRMRRDTGRLQSLVSVGDPVDNAALIAWVRARGVAEPVTRADLGLDDWDGESGDTERSADPARDWFHQACPWETLLPDWEYAFGSGDTEFWRRPGATKRHSATINADGNNKIFLFTSSVTDVPCNQYLDKYQFYAFAHCGGDWQKARQYIERKYNDYWVKKEILCQLE